MKWVARTADVKAEMMVARWGALRAGCLEFHRVVVSDATKGCFEAAAKALNLADQTVECWGS
jgi:hypothetical protein